VAPPKVAIVAGTFLLLTRAVKPEKVYREIDWTLLLMFAGLFVVVAGLSGSSGKLRYMIVAFPRREMCHAWPACLPARADG
jgi:Na+/H+ antiporter NhaD/arsenite permease-like protein